VVVTAHDAYDNVVTSFAGVQSFTWTTTSGGLNSLPSGVRTFVAGTYSFGGSAFALVTAGNQTVTFTASGKSGTSGNVTIVPGALRSYYLEVVSGSTPMTGFEVMVFAKDAYNNTRTTDASTVHVDLLNYTTLEDAIAILYTNATYEEPLETDNVALADGHAHLYIASNSTETILIAVTGTGSPPPQGSKGPIVIGPEVPGAPELYMISSSYNFGTGVTLMSIDWTAPDNGGATITGYIIYRGTAPGVYSLLGEVDGVTLQYTDNTVVAGTHYYYVVSAQNSAGEGAQSGSMDMTALGGGV
jgi:hypothetical protein